MYETIVRHCVSNCQKRLVTVVLTAEKKCILMLRGSTIGEGGDTTVSSPGRLPKQPLPGMRLHDPLHGRQDSPEFIAFDQGVSQTCPR